MVSYLDDKDRPLYNSRIINTFIKLIKSRYHYVNVLDLLSEAKMTPHEVADQGHWFTQDQVNLFYDTLVKLTGKIDIAREAGRYAASPDAIGAMRQYILGMVGPAKAYEMVGWATSKFTRSSDYTSKKVSSNKVEITVTPKDGAQERLFQCENRTGFFEAMTMIFTNKLPQISHPECMFQGGSVCRYTITWENPISITWKRVVNGASFVYLAAVIAILLSLPVAIFKLYLPVMLAGGLVLTLLTLISSRIENNELKKSLSNLNGSTDKLVDQIEVNYNQARLVNEIGHAISRHMNIEDVLENVIQISKNRLDYDRGLILLANKEKTRLQFRAGFGYSPSERQFLTDASFHLDRPDSKGVFVISFREQKPYLINDVRAIGQYLSLRSLAFAKKLGTQSFICCPIICDDEPLGILAVDNVKTKRPLVQSDMNLLMGIAPVLGISIRNAELINAQVMQMRSILQVMAASIDARDPMTAGHSEKVTVYAIGICGELGLSADYTEVVGVAASLHDYGKIGVPDALLKKEGRLTDDEYEIVKTHASRTREILSRISFEGMLRQVPDIAGFHHEKLDGSGYPLGLKGDEIPLGAQILAVADFFEAITAKRHYRAPMELDEAFLLLRQGVGWHFKERIVDAFIRYYVKENTDKRLRLVSSA